MTAFRKISFTLAALGLFCAAPVFAADIPGSADPGRIQERFAPATTPDLSKAAPGVSSGAATTTAPAGAENAKLTLQKVVIEGMTAYDELAIAPLYADMIGQQISLADVYGLAERMTAKYRNEGYILTQVIVPPQTIDGGTVRLRVIEGFVDQVSFQGETRGDIGYLLPFAEKIKAAKPLNAKALERYLLLMNDIAGISARAVLSPSPTVPGASDVTLVVSQKAADFTAQIDNRGSRYLGAFQASVGTRLNNVFGLYEAFNVQVVTAPDGQPDRELDYIGLTWSQPVGHEGTKVDVSASITSTKPGFDLEAFGIEGVAHSYNIQVSHPFIRSRNKNLFATLKFNYLNSERSDNIPTGTIEDRLRVLRAGGTWQFTDSLIGVNTLTAELSRGLDVLGASDKEDPALTRAAGDPEFFKATFDVSRLQRLNNRFDLFGAISGQISPDTLLASEEFGVGGAAFGSAYDNSEITGEDGIAARLELRVNNPFNITSLPYLQMYGFYDIGNVWDKDNAIVKEQRRSLSSAGTGLRFNISDNFSGTFEVAAPLTREVETENDNSVRAFGSLTARF